MIRYDSIPYDMKQFYMEQSELNMNFKKRYIMFVQLKLDFQNALKHVGQPEIAKKLIF